MFVYRDETSMDARRQVVGSLSVSITNSVESFRCEGSFFTCGCSHLSTNCEIGSVMLLQLDTMGLIPIGFLCIFFRKYNLGVRGLFGGLQKSNQVSLISPLFLKRVSFF